MTSAILGKGLYTRVLNTLPEVRVRTPSILRTILQRGFASSASESPVFREFAIMLPSSLSSHVSFVHGPLGHMFVYIDIYLHLFASDARECLFTQSSAGLLYSITYLYGYFSKNPWMLKISREHQSRSKFVSDSKRHGPRSLLVRIQSLDFTEELLRNSNLFSLSCL